MLQDALNALCLWVDKCMATHYCCW